jgi:predicted transcriptional regulator
VRNRDLDGYDLTVPEVAAKFGRTEHTVRRWIAARILVAKTVGDMTYVSRGSAEAYFVRLQSFRAEVGRAVEEGWLPPQEFAELLARKQ